MVGGGGGRRGGEGGEHPSLIHSLTLYLFHEVSFFKEFLVFTPRWDTMQSEAQPASS